MRDITCGGVVLQFLFTIREFLTHSQIRLLSAFVSTKTVFTSKDPTVLNSIPTTRIQ